MGIDLAIDNTGASRFVTGIGGQFSSGSLPARRLEQFPRLTATPLTD